MTITCPECGQPVDVDDGAIGERVEVEAVCACGQRLVVDVPGPAQGQPLSMFVESGRDPAVDGSGIWDEGGVARVVRGAKLPHRCFRCNAAAERSVPFLLKWAAPEERGHAIAVAVIEKMREQSIVVRAYACPRHMLVLKVWRWAGWTVAGVGALLLVLAAAFDLAGVLAEFEDRMALIGVALIVVGLVLRLIKPGGLLALRIDREEATVSGFGLPFMAALPEWANAAAERANLVAGRLGRLSE